MLPGEHADRRLLQRPLVEQLRLPVVGIRLPMRRLLEQTLQVRAPEPDGDGRVRIGAERRLLRDHHRGIRRTIGEPDEIEALAASGQGLMDAHRARVGRLGMEVRRPAIRDRHDLVEGRQGLGLQPPRSFGLRRVGQQPHLVASLRERQGRTDHGRLGAIRGPLAAHDAQLHGRSTPRPRGPSGFAQDTEATRTPVAGMGCAQAAQCAACGQGREGCMGRLSAWIMPQNCPGAIPGLLCLRGAADAIGKHLRAAEPGLSLG